VLTTLNFNLSVALAGFVPNIFDTQPGAQIFRQLPRRTYIEIYGCTNPPTTAGAFVAGQLTFGNVIRVPESVGAFQAFTASLGPTEQDHMWYGGAAEALDQVILSLRNTDTAALLTRIRVKYQ
jgi:hypothetical protein